jgi:alkaline phosphatase D
MNPTTLPLAPVRLFRHAVLPSGLPSLVPSQVPSVVPSVVPSLVPSLVLCVMPSLVLCVMLSTAADGQFIPDYDLGGASKPRPDLSFRKEDQYKRVHQSSLRFILRGELDKTEEFLTKYNKDHPDDAETLYMLGILRGQRGDVAKAESFLKKAIAAGLPDNRIIAGPREMMKPVAGTELYQSLAEKYSRNLVQGPLVGNVSDSTASFWVRTAAESKVEVTIHDASGEIVSRSSVVRSQASEDYTAVAAAKGLQPNTEYSYAVSLDGNVCDSQAGQKFRTLSPQGTASKFVLAFGGGAGYVPENERMWNTIASFDPHAILLLGDNVYIDDPESVVMQQYTYQRRQSRPEWRALTARSPVFTIWDDHDFSTNDSWGGADIATPFWKKDWVFPIYRQNWANPGYGGGDDQPGCWYSFHIGDVDFIMLDCRYYRTSPKSKDKTMLGSVQKKWLKEQLSEATGTFKVICSSVPWDFRTKGDSLDTWNGYKKEHEEILSFIETQNIEGVLLMSADRHRSDCWKIPRAGSYGLYEFNSSRLTNQHIHPTMEKKGAIFSYNKLQSFGLLTFDTTAADPQVTYEVVNIDGQKPHSITVKRSELTKK